MDNKESRITTIEKSLEEEKWYRFWDRIFRYWYHFSRNKFSVLGMSIVVLVILLAILAPYVTPYPEHAGPFVDFKNAGQPPSIKYWVGTDTIGRDIFTRIIFALRDALVISILVLAIAVPLGTLVGLLAGFFYRTIIDTIIMRISDIFLSVPSLVLALSIAAVLKPNQTNAMIAITVMWWPWYTRLVYGMASSIRNEYFVIAAELTGASKFHILFREILPNCLSPIFTKMALDVGWVIIVSASLNFVGLGTQPPKPSLGQMVSEGAKYLPEFWWMCIFPALAIIIMILGVNLLGDGIRDMLQSSR
ncbi:putative D,D-dipeptide transport system permease protein DdpC [subsurface metagenome]